MMSAAHTENDTESGLDELDRCDRPGCGRARLWHQTTLAQRFCAGFVETRATPDNLDQLLGLVDPGTYIEVTLACARWTPGDEDDHSVVYGRTHDTLRGRADFARLEREVLASVCGECDSPMELREPSEGRPPSH
jgi:hypothetical protein